MSEPRAQTEAEKALTAAARAGNGLWGVAGGFFLGSIVFILGDVAVSRMRHSERKAIGSATTVSGLARVLGAVLDGVGGGVLACVLAYAGEAILTMLATSMMPEAFDPGGRGSGLTTVFGFAVAYGIEWIAA